MVVNNVFDYVFVWGNDEKRALLKGKRCRVLARGRMNSVIVEFEDGQQECTSRNAVRLIVERRNMTEERRNYRSEQPTPSTPPETASQPSTPAPDPAPRKDGEFKNISGLFRSASGKADKVTVTEDIFAKLQDIKVGDVLGVSGIPRTDRIGLWYIKKEV